MNIRRMVLLAYGVLLPAMAQGLTIYRVELVGGGVVFAESKPKASGTSLVFRSSPQGILVALRRSEIARVVEMQADNKPPVDLGRATVKTVAAARPDSPSTQAGANMATTGTRATAPLGRRYKTGDDQPGNRVAFPVSRDDLLPGNYQAFPAANGGQSGPPPMMEEGRGTPKAGSLAEPPKAIQLPEPNTSPNIQVPAAPLVYSEKPRVDDKQSPKPTPPPRRSDLA